MRVDDGDGGAPGSGLTEAGTRERLAVHVVRDPRSVPQVASLGPDPLDPAFDEAALAALLAGSRQQVGGLLRTSPSAADRRTSRFLR